MTIDNSIISIGMSLLSWVALLSFIVKVSMRFGALELKVDTMWGFQMRRAMSEVLQTGIGVKNSPLLFNDRTLQVIEPMRTRLMTWYKDRAPPMLADGNLILELEQSFGDEITETVCVPCKISYGACLVLALAVAKGHNPADINMQVSQDQVDRRGNGY